jgi:hypothetical protein
MRLIRIILARLCFKASAKLALIGKRLIDV